jgi:hypothetical protein
MVDGEKGQRLILILKDKSGKLDIEVLMKFHSEV